MTSYKIATTWKKTNGYLEDQAEDYLVNAESEAEAIEQVKKTCTADGVDLPEAISVEDLGHKIIFDCDTVDTDIVKLAEAAIEALPAGCMDETYDDRHTLVMESFRYGRRRYLSVGTVKDWEPSLMDESIGYFTVAEIEIKDLS